MDRLYQSTNEAPQRNALVLEWLNSALAMQRLKALNLVHDALRSTGTQPSAEVLTRMRAMTKDPEEAVRAKLIAVLRDLGMLEDASRIAAMAEGEPSPSVRQEIYKALGKLANPETIPVCIQGLDAPETQVAGAAAEALGQLCNAGNGQPKQKVVDQAIIALKERYAAKPEPSTTLRRSLVEAMAHIADPKVAAILVQHAGADEPDAAVRQIALLGLGRLGDPDHLGIVLDRLNGDPDASVRATAAKVVGQIGYDLSHLKALQERTDRDSEPNAAVVSQAWEAYLSLFQRLGPEEQTKALRTWEDREPDRMILLAAKIKSEIREDVAAFLLQYVTNLNQTDHEAAVAFVELLSQTIPDRFGRTWAERFEKACQPPSPESQPTTTRAAD
jgi:HEAT repeat protein